MKNFSLFLFGLCFLIGSCSKEDTLTQLEENAWLLVNYEDANCDLEEDNELDLIASSIPCIEDEGACLHQIMTFTEGTLIAVLSQVYSSGQLVNSTDTAEYSLSDDKITICEDTNDCETFTISIENNQMTLAGEKDSYDGCQDLITFAKQ